MFPAAGSTTASANATATAASTALPRASGCPRQLASREFRRSDHAVCAAHRLLRHGLEISAGFAESLRVARRNEFGNCGENERSEAGCFFDSNHKQKTLSDRGIASSDANCSSGSV